MKKDIEQLNAILPLVALIGAILLYTRGAEGGALALLGFAGGHLVPSPLDRRP